MPRRSQRMQTRKMKRQGKSQNENESVGRFQNKENENLNENQSVCRSEAENENSRHSSVRNQNLNEIRSVCRSEAEDENGCHSSVRNESVCRFPESVCHSPRVSHELSDHATNRVRHGFSNLAPNDKESVCRSPRVSHGFSNFAPNRVSHGQQVPANESYGRKRVDQRYNDQFVWRNNQMRNDADCLILDDENDDFTQSKYPKYVSEIFAMIRKSGISSKRIPMDGDCGAHSVIASLQINSGKFDLTIDELLSKMNLVTGSGYWWSVEELSTLVSKIGCGLFTIECHGNRNVLHYFNAQQNLKRNIFLHLKNNHYEVIDLKKNNGLEFDMVCEITKGTPETTIQNSILKHMSQSLRNGFDEKFPEMEKAKYDKLVFSEEKQNGYRKNREPSCDNDSRENRSFDKSRNNESKWRIGLKKSRIPKFKPFKESPEKFLILIEWELELNETPKTSWVEAIKYFLDPTDGSFLWYQKHSNEFGNNWRYFCQEFKENYSLYHSTDQKQKEYYDMNYELGKK